MHELSIALSIIDIATEEGERLGAASIEAVHLKVGAFSGVVKEALLSAFELAREGTPLEKAGLVIEVVPVTLCCRACGVTQAIAVAQDVCCGACGALDVEVVAGRELEITAMEIAECQV